MQMAIPEEPEPLDSVDRIEAAWRVVRPEMDVSSIGITTRFWRLARHLAHARDGNLEVHGTDRGTIEVLAELRRAGAPYTRTAGELRSRIMVSSSGLSQRLQRLERDGLVRRTVSDRDRRVIDVQLTDAGLAFIDDVVGDILAQESRLIAGLSDEERERMRVLLRKLLRSMEEQQPS